VHAFLGRTSAALVGVSLDDLTGEVEPVNQPGVTSRSARNWSRRLRLPLERIAVDADVATALGGLDRGGRSRSRVRSC
jgi:4-alpha-glucanotransferase